MLQKTLTQSFFILLTLGVATIAPVAADGGKAKNAIYDASVRTPTGDAMWQFHIDTSPIIFYLGTVNNRYHVLLIRVMNNDKVPLRLDKDQDGVELQFAGGRNVKGLLNLRDADHVTWDGLETQIRTAVAYPQGVEANEEEGVYVYVPVDQVAGPRKEHQMPIAINYNIKSISTTIKLRPPAAAAKY